MNKICGAAVVAGVLASAAIGLATGAAAAPSGPPSVTQVVSSLQMQGYKVVVNSIGAASLEQCTMYTVRPGQTYTRMDSGFAGAGNDLITKVVSMTVFLDTNC